VSAPLPGRRVLIVSADPDLREYVRACLPAHLARFGDVLEAGDGLHALEIVRGGATATGSRRDRHDRPGPIGPIGPIGQNGPTAPGGPVDLVISDLVLPGLDGLALARACTRQRPPVPVLLLAADLTDREARAAGAAGVLTKPFNRRRLRGWVEGVLGTGAADPG